MLEKIDRNPVGTYESVKLLDVSAIHPDSCFECIACVRGGRHKFTRSGKPFITLYLQDVNGVVIPGYIFDLADTKSLGLDLKKISNSIVKVKLTENYSKKYGMSVLIDKVEMVVKPDQNVVQTFVGSVGDPAALYNELVNAIQKRIGVKVNLPYDICTSSYMEHYMGKVGGQCKHYINMLRLLDVWASDMTEQEAHELFVTFVLYVFVHNNYMSAAVDGNDDITLVNTLTASVSKYMEALHAGSGAIEVIHIFFGYEPKDLFVRTVHQASLYNLRMNEEYSAYKALPVGLEGDAGYGKIKKYAST